MIHSCFKKLLATLCFAEKANIHATAARRLLHQDGGILFAHVHHESSARRRKINPAYHLSTLPAKSSSPSRWRKERGAACRWKLWLCCVPREARSCMCEGSGAPVRPGCRPGWGMSGPTWKQRAALSQSPVQQLSLCDE